MPAAEPAPSETVPLPPVSRQGARPAPIPIDEAARQQRLDSYRVLDTPPEPQFDDAVLLASAICKTPVALITLVDRDRQWFKARKGIDAEETHRDLSFCAHAILEQGVFEVPDSQADERFRDNPYVVGDPHVRFYAGAPLRDESGSALGTLCVVDYEARHLDDTQRDALAALGRMVVGHLRLRAAHLTLQEMLVGLRNDLALPTSVRRDVTNRLGHNLNTPLTPLVLQLRILRSSVTDEHGRKALDAIDRNIARLSEAVQDVLAFTAGQRPPPQAR